VAGILGDALLGAAAGGGKVGAEGYLKEQEQQTAAANAASQAKLVDQLTSAREERNMALQAKYQRDLETEVRQPFTSEQNAAQRQSTEGIAAMGRESAESIAAANNASAERRAATARKHALEDAMKDTPASVKAFVDVHRERLKALDAAERDPMLTDQGARDKITAQKEEILSIIEQALTTKSIPARKPAAPASKPDPLGLRGDLPKRDTAPQNRPGNQPGPQPAPEPRKPSGQRIYGPLTPESIIENDVALGIPAALEYIKSREERRQRLAQRDRDRERELVSP
jgi:hypothetical protein